LGDLFSHRLSILRQRGADESSCDEVGLNLGGGKVIRTKAAVSRNTDIGVLKTKWKRDPLPSDLSENRRIGEHGYFFGFPQGCAATAALRKLFAS